VTPKSGRLLVFHNCHLNSSTRHPDSNHAGKPVERGEKCAAGRLSGIAGLHTTRSRKLGLHVGFYVNAEALTTPSGGFGPIRGCKPLVPRAVTFVCFVRLLDCC
jgi:hypothetical protein